MRKKITEIMNRSFKNSHAPSTQERGYYQAAGDWYQEKYELISISRQRYRMLAIGLGILLGLSMTTFTAILPLKQYIYRLIEVNQQTGEVTELKQTDSMQFASQWVVSRYFIHQYVLNRHMYNLEDIKRTFNLALSMSAKPIADDYAQMIIDTNPTSPLNTLHKDYYREVNVLGINQLNDNTALVRFKVITHHKNNASDIKTEDLQAIVKWVFNNPEESLKDRDQNPLGFYVTYYQVSPIQSADSN